MTSSAPGFILAPDISLDIDLANFELQNITDVLFETITIDIPTEPVITFPVRPNVIDPLEPVAPEIALDEFTPEQLLSAEVQTSCQDRVDIVLPGPLNIRKWTEEVPVFERPEPSGVVAFEYEEFSYALTKVLVDRYDLLLLPTEYFSRMLSRNTRIWSDTVDWVTQRGNDNSYLTRKDLDTGRAIHGTKSFVIIENYRNEISLKKLFISGRQTHEEVLRQTHDVRQKINFSFVSSVMDNSVKHFNSCIQKFNAQIATYRELATVYLGDIARQRVIIQDLELRMRLSEGLSNYNTAVLQRLRAEVEVQKGVIRFFQSQMNLARAELRVELLQAQVDRLEIQIFAQLNRALVDQIRQDIAEQEAEIAKAKVIKLDAIKERLEAEIIIAEVQLTSARDKFQGDRQAFEVSQQARKEQHGDFPKDVQAREDLLNAQFFNDESRGFFAKAITEAQLEEVVLREGRLTGKFERDISEAVGTAVVNLTIAKDDSVLAKARVEAREFVRTAELDAQRTLAKSDITQSLIHELAEGS